MMRQTDSPHESMSAALAAQFDLRRLTPEFYANPYPVYDALRAHEPVKRMPDGSYLLSRYADLLAVYKDAQRFSSDKTREFKPKYGDSLLYEHHTTSLVFNDPPLHTRVRKLIIGALAPKAIDAMEGALAALVERLLDDIESRAECDLIECLASAIPVEIIGNLLGVPHADRAPLRAWSLAILGALEPAITPEQSERGNRAVGEFLAYLKELVAHRRAHPGDAEHDVLTRLIQGESDGERLTEPELLHNCIFILNAGHETTTNLIGNGLWLLAQWPQERARLLAQPELMRSAVEEFLRCESSNQLGNRITTCEVEVGGVTLAPGTPVTLCIGAANRDPAQFPDPHRMDVARSPNRHLAFGSGPHQCAGIALARLEGRIAIAAFLARFPRYELAGEPTRGARARFRGFVRLPVRVHRS